MTQKEHFLLINKVKEEGWSIVYRFVFDVDEQRLKDEEAKQETTFGKLTSEFQRLSVCKISTGSQCVPTAAMVRCKSWALPTKDEHKEPIVIC